MSELQISLIGIGIAVVVAVYFYNWRVQRQYQRKFGAAFTQHEDALYSGDKHKNQDAASGRLDTLMDVADPGQLLPGDKARANSPDEVCNLLDEMSDFIVEIFPISLADADALGPLWQRRFDFGKNVSICGQDPATGKWEKVIAESQVSYGAFKLGLQLASRTGVVSAAKLAEFSELASEIGSELQAEITLPDVAEAVLRATRLDKFCAEVDQMIGVNLLPNGENTLSAGEIAQVSQLLGMSLQADGSFHLFDSYGHTLYSLCNIENTPFQHHTFNHMSVKGLTLLLEVPRVNQPALRFDEMVVLARRLAQNLDASLVDDHRVVLSDTSLVQIREQIASIESRMLAGDIEPGSPRARRLFA